MHKQQQQKLISLMLLVKLLHDLVYSVFFLTNQFNSKCKIVEVLKQSIGSSNKVFSWKAVWMWPVLYWPLKTWVIIIDLSTKTLIWNLYYVIKHITASLWHIIIFHEVFIWITRNSISLYIAANY